MVAVDKKDVEMLYLGIFKNRMEGIRYCASDKSVTCAGEEGSEAML